MIQLPQKDYLVLKRNDLNSTHAVCARSSHHSHHRWDRFLQESAKMDQIGPSMPLIWRPRCWERKPCGPKSCWSSETSHVRTPSARLPFGHRNGHLLRPRDRSLDFGEWGRDNRVSSHLQFLRVGRTPTPCSHLFTLMFPHGLNTKFPNYLCSPCSYLKHHLHPFLWAKARSFLNLNFPSVKSCHFDPYSTVNPHASPCAVWPPSFHKFMWVNLPFPICMASTPICPCLHGLNPILSPFEWIESQLCVGWSASFVPLSGSNV